jgi:hypothetical protein
MRFHLSFWTPLGVVLPYIDQLNENLVFMVIIQAGCGGNVEVDFSQSMVFEVGFF